jgi:hypothetical protein
VTLCVLTCTRNSSLIPPCLHRWDSSYFLLRPHSPSQTLLGSPRSIHAEMASYLAYFTSNRDGQPPYSQQAPPSGGSSQWTNTISSRIGALRKALTKDSEEDDPDNEDCSHVSNVLRAYYTEKGRLFPDWLPPDPKKPAAQVPPPVQYGQVNQYAGYGASQYGNQEPHSRGGSGGRGGLSDLWDPSPAQASQQPQLQSLRTARPTPQSLRPNDSTGSGRGMSPAPSFSVQQPRPLPSQRSGSYQTTQNAGGGGLSSRDRLRARVQGGGGSGRNSPAQQSSMANTMTQNPSHQSGSYSSNGSSASPYVSASEPWSSGQDDYFGGTTGGQGSSRNRPSGAR